MNDAPLDYRTLWLKLRALLERTGVQEAVSAMGSKEEFKMRQAQGAFDMCRRVVAMMDDILERERGADSAFLDEDSSVKH